MPALLKDLLAKALSPDTFTILSCDLNPEELPLCQQVFQETRVRHPSTSQLASSHSYVLAVVDRTADLERAAKHLVTARFAFGGTSPYAPDLVLVNEFVMKRFCDLVLKYAIPYLTDTSTSIKRSLEVKDYIPEHWTPRILTQGNTGAIIQLTAKSPRNIPLPEKQRQHPPVFAITAITSLDNAIDLIAHATSLQPCLAAYHFGAPSHAQYLSQFIDAEVSFINHIPQRLLLGPAAPSFQPFDLLTRYTPYHFTKPCPAYCSSSTHTTVQEKTESRDFLSGNITSLSKKDQAVLLASAAAEIKERKRPESIAIGFFEQGIFIGLGVYGVPLLACVSAGLFYGVRIGFRYFKGML